MKEIASSAELTGQKLGDVLQYMLVEGARPPPRRPRRHWRNAGRIPTIKRTRTGVLKVSELVAESPPDGLILTN